MGEDLTRLDLFDLLSERHLQCRKTIEDTWNEQNDIQLSNTEWFILYQLHKQKQTIIGLCNTIGITRQAMHKLINKMEKLGLVTTDLTRNKKYAQITEFGNICYEKNKAIKAKLEGRIKNKIGEDAYGQLKQLLAADWGM